VGFHVGRVGRRPQRKEREVITPTQVDQVRRDILERIDELFELIDDPAEMAALAERTAAWDEFSRRAK
jgi:hypothetical protein